MKDGKGNSIKAKKYVSYRAQADGVSKEWDSDAYKVRIAGLYPSLVKLMDQAESDWNSGDAKKTYAEIRKKGWRRRLRK